MNAAIIAITVCTIVGFLVAMFFHFKALNSAIQGAPESEIDYALLAAHLLRLLHEKRSADSSQGYLAPNQMTPPDDLGNNITTNTMLSSVTDINQFRRGRGANA
jgi:hypothetical protein